MINFKVTADEQFKEYIVNRAAFNKLVRESLVEGPAAYWIDHYLKLHFETMAYARYQYAYRSRNYDRKKQFQEFWTINGRQVRNINVGKSPVLPFVLTGEMRESVLGNARSGSMLTQVKGRYITATSNKIRVRVPVTFPHVINPKNAGEMVRLHPNERVILHQRAHSVLKQKMKAFQPRVRERTEIKAAG